MCEITAPMPYAKASDANFNFKIGSQWASIFAGSIRSLKALEVLLHSGVHFQ